jgi:hypothetical protein
VERTFTDAEVMEAAYGGSFRRLTAIKLGRVHRHAYDGADAGGTWTMDIEAFGAEMLVARHFGRYHGWQEETDEDGDVGPIQVRHTLRPDGCLIVHPDDSDEAPFILVVGQMPHQQIKGGIRGERAKRPEFWRDDVRNPAFFVPQEALTRLRS